MRRINPEQVTRLSTTDADGKETVWLDRVMITGVAGQRIETGQVVMRGDDGKTYYLAEHGRQVGIAMASIEKGQTFNYGPANGHCYPVKP